MVFTGMGSDDQMMLVRVRKHSDGRFDPLDGGGEGGGGRLGLARIESNIGKHCQHEAGRFIRQTDDSSYLYFVTDVQSPLLITPFIGHLGATSEIGIKLGLLRARQ